MKVFKNKSTRVLILIMGTLFVCAILIANIYYSYQNRSVDPRIIKANDLYTQYNELANASDYDAIFLLMDSIEFIYSQIEHYERSYEVGVLYNNRAASYIAMALHVEDDTDVKDSLLELAKYNVLTSIELYSEWIEKYDDKTENEIIKMLEPHFNPEDSIFLNKNINRFINKRVKQIESAMIETPRRLSVSHTNLGIIYRHKEQYEDAIVEYIKALELWPDNLSAENNLNVLFDKPLKKRSTFRKIFPKDRL